MPHSAIRRDLLSAVVDQQIQGLQRLARLLSTDSVHDQRPDDWAQRKLALGDVEPRLQALSHSEDETVRELAADGLGCWLGDAALTRLLELTQDPVERVRASAVGALDNWPDSGVARQIVLDAVDAPNWTVRMRGARALWPFAGTEVDDALFDALLDPDGYVRMCAADSLRRRDPARLLMRFRTLHDYPAPHMLDAALDLMGAVGTLDDAKFLEKAGSWLNLSQPSFVRQWSRRAARAIRKRLNGKG